MDTNFLYFNLRSHQMHILSASSWPFTAAFSLSGLFIGFLFWFYYRSTMSVLLFLTITLISFFNWWKDVAFEAMGHSSHVLLMQSSKAYSFSWFILSEVMFFAGFFWSFGHYSLFVSVDTGEFWPPLSIEPVSVSSLPLLNTILLLSSSVTVTWAHAAAYKNHLGILLMSLKWTILLGFLFLMCQAFEFYFCSFTIHDSVFSSTFFIITSFHGFHVLVSLLWLTTLVSLVRCRILNFYTTSSLITHNFSSNACCIYWHSVDVLWLIIMVVLYAVHDLPTLT